MDDKARLRIRLTDLIAEERIVRNHLSGDRSVRLEVSHAAIRPQCGRHMANFRVARSHQPLSWQTEITHDSQVHSAGRQQSLHLSGRLMRLDSRRLQTNQETLLVWQRRA